MSDLEKRAWEVVHGFFIGGGGDTLEQRGPQNGEGHGRTQVVQPDDRDVAQPEKWGTEVKRCDKCGGSGQLWDERDVEQLVHMLLLAHSLQAHPTPPWEE